SRSRWTRSPQAIHPIPSTSTIPSTHCIYLPAFRSASCSTTDRRRRSAQAARAPDSHGHAMTHLQTPAATYVLHRDATLLVINKPSGLLVHRGWANDKITALSIARGLAGQHVYPIHRLDRGASGVLVFGLSPEVAR